MATNAMLERKGSRVVKNTTSGFRDILDFRRGYKEHPVDVRLPAPEPLVRRRHRIGVAERVNSEGKVHRRLDEAGLRQAVTRLHADRVEAYAVCFLQGPVNPVHEQRAGAVIRELLGDVSVSLSSEVLGQIGEFERFSAAVANAYVSPVLCVYFSRLARSLDEAGFAGQLLIMRSDGGSSSPEQTGRFGVGALLSGPAGGVVAAAEAGRVSGFADVIGVDMGGTSYDVSLVRGGVPAVRNDAWVGRVRIAVPTLDIHTIGAGGGSIAWIDRGGALRVGPQSAGAMPGPACYGRGGTRPTVTDADVVLGYLGRANFANGEIALDVSRAREAIETHVARPLGQTVDEAAVSIARIVNNNMSNGIRAVSIARGHDPRDFALVAFGGAAATHAPVQARDLGISTVLVPKLAGVFSAVGALMSEVRASSSVPYLRAVDRADPAEITALFAGLWERHRAEVETPGVAAVHRILSADMRYVGQVHELPIPVASLDGEVTAQTLAEAVAAFHQLHERFYTFELSDTPVEIVTLRQQLVGTGSAIEWPRLALSDHACATSVTRKLWVPNLLGEFAPAEALVYDARRVAVGQKLRGPAVIEEQTTTIVLFDGDTAYLSDQGVYM
ncbi:MAG: hydantoinase/oxoprolinase family protein, partial [Solirubrobacteraceae bacterium]